MGVLLIVGEIVVEIYRKLNNLLFNGIDIFNYVRGDII